MAAAAAGGEAPEARGWGGVCVYGGGALHPASWAGTEAASMFVHWVHGLRHSLSVVGYNMHLDPAAMHNIDISELRICLSAHLARVWNNLAPNPRVCPSAGARLCTYFRWFAQPTNNKADLLRLPLPRKAMVSFLRFRTGCHALPNVIGTRTGVPRS